jgi:hypothetical protein
MLGVIVHNNNRIHGENRYTMLDYITDATFQYGELIPHN